MEVLHITFDELKRYWIEVDHFQDASKVYTEIVPQLGPYQCELSNPKRFAYGLFAAGQLIGATHISEWNREWVRCRTINIRPPYRGGDLGWHLLSTALKRDWSQARALLGWVRESAHDWCSAHGFVEIDGIWHGRHIGMVRDLRDLS